MDMKLCSYDLPVLKVMYEQEAEVLQRALLNGATWEEVREQRKKVTDLAIAMHKKRFASTNPAESSSRD